MPASPRTLAPPPQAKQQRSPISRKQVDVVFARSVAVFGLVFGAQTIPSLLGQLDEAYPLWLYIVVIGLFGTLALATIASFATVLVKQVQGAFAVMFLLALLTWPIAILPGAEVFTGIHWLNYLITVATAMAAIAFRPRTAAAFLFVYVFIYALVRVTPLGGGATPLLSVLESTYAVLLGGIVIIIITMLRQAATGVDGAQATALDRYAHAVRQHATEVERVEVDSIVHDSVLTTLISASRARTPEATHLAATMASNTMGYLRNAAAASPDDGSMLRISTLADRVAYAVGEHDGAFEYRARSLGTRSMPSHAADAVYAAAAQAMINSVRHAGDDSVTRWVAVRGLTPAGIEVVVGDTGSGFILSDIAEERLGVRVSILERLANSGGRAVIASAPGDGTIVTVRWPAPDEAAPDTTRAEGVGQ